MSTTPGKFILTADETWQFRRAQSVPPPLAQAVRRACEANTQVRDCYLLDARKEASGDVKFVIALSLDTEVKNMERAVIQLQEVLRDFPEIAENTAIMSAKRFESDYAGAKFYVRGGGLKRFARLFLFAVLLFGVATASAQMAVSVSPVKIIGQKAIVPLALKNNFTENIESARAVVFLLDEQGIAVAQPVTRWVIGEINTNGLPAGATNTFHFVIASEKPIITTNLIAKVNFTRVVLEGGKLADIAKDVIVTPITR